MKFKDKLFIIIALTLFTIVNQTAPTIVKAAIDYGNEQAIRDGFITIYNSLVADFKVNNAIKTYYKTGDPSYYDGSDTTGIIAPPIPPDATDRPLDVLIIDNLELSTAKKAELNQVSQIDGDGHTYQFGLSDKLMIFALVKGTAKAIKELNDRIEVLEGYH